MESIKKARMAIAKDAFTNANLTDAFGLDRGGMLDTSTLPGVFDAIEAEIAERYMELPLDADGVPIHCGDRIISETGHEGDVWLIGTFDLMTSDHIYHDNTKVHHYKPRTLVDLLQDFLIEYDRLDDLGMTPLRRYELFAEYADKIRKMVE